MSKEFDILVAGGGIAGFTAALTAARLGHRTVVLTGDTLGGHLLNIERIDGYPGFPEGVAGYDLGPIAQEQAMGAGAEVAMVSLTGLEPTDTGWSVSTPGETYAARCVILATGTRLRALGVPGESDLRGKGVSHCASCDAPLMRDQAVVVAGGGDSALQEALVLAEHCASVTVVHHGAEYTAQAAYRAPVDSNEKIKAVPESEIVEILGTDGVTGVRVRNTQTDATEEIDCAGAFVFIGLEPNTGFLDDASLLDDAGAIVTDAAMRTRQEGLLAAGTVRAGSAGRAAAAAGEGAAAALAADAWLRGTSWVADSGSQ